MATPTTAEHGRCIITSVTSGSPVMKGHSPTPKPCNYGHPKPFVKAGGGESVKATCRGVMVEARSNRANGRGPAPQWQLDSGVARGAPLQHRDSDATTTRSEQDAGSFGQGQSGSVEMAEPFYHEPRLPGGFVTSTHFADLVPAFHGASKPRLDSQLAPRMG